MKANLTNHFSFDKRFLTPSVDHSFRRGTLCPNYLLADVAHKVLHHSVGDVVPVAKRTHRHPAWHPLALVLHMELLQVFAAVHGLSFFQAKVIMFSTGPKFDHKLLTTFDL